MMQVMFHAKHHMHEIAEKHGLTVMQSSMLAMLKDGEPLAMRVLSDSFMCDASNVTGLADRLEARGLVKRQDHPTDRRIKLIALTDDGAKLRDTILAEAMEVEATRINPVLNEDERATLLVHLQKILSAH